MIWVRVGSFERLGNCAPAGAWVWGGVRAGSDDRVVSGLRVGEGVGEGGGDGSTESCGLSLNSVGMAGRASLRGVRGGGRDCLGR